MDWEETLKNIDWNKAVERFVEERKKEQEENEAFWKTETFELFANCLKEVYDESIDEEFVYYNWPKVDNLFKFTQAGLTKEDVENCLSKVHTLPDNEFKILPEDPNIVFPHEYTYIERYSLYMFVMHGQGTLTVLSGTPLNQT